MRASDITQNMMHLDVNSWAVIGTAHGTAMKRGCGGTVIGVCDLYIIVNIDRT